MGWRRARRWPGWASRRPRSAVAIEGPLRELSLQDVMQLLELAHKTGVLTVRSERQNDEGLIHLDRGEIVFAKRRRSTRFLGQQLLRAGKLTERELERALELQQRRPSERLSEILLEMGSVPEADLVEQLGFQLEESVHEMMAWRDGYFRFEEGPDVFRSRVQVRIRVESLLMEGARRIDEWSRLESRVPSLESVPALAAAGDSAGSAPLDLRPDEWEVLAEIDGERDVRHIAADLGRSTFDVAKIVFGLVSTGVAEVQERPTRVPVQALGERLGRAEQLLAAGRPEEAERLLETLQTAHPERADVALLMGRTLLRQGRARAATEAFARVVSLDPDAAEGYYHLGTAAAKIGELDRAARAWTTYLRLTSDEAARLRVEKGLAAVGALRDLLQTTGDHE
jgi:tetratricopeptide (TPR) repeat protein